jgi:hypothetical protein
LQEEYKKMLTEAEKANTLKTYNDGKFSRLNLMFAVNGGAFAIAKLLFENNKPLLGKITLPHVAFGAIIFTVVMIADTWHWSSMMKKHFLEDLAFSCFGKIALILLGLLIILAWALAGFF